jgi:hypothetical protein
VTPDDALAGNNNNNETWRQVTVSGSGTAWNFGFTGSSHRAEYAIKAWRAADPAVTLSEIQVAGDGLVIVGCRVTDVGLGLQRYEYAVQNMNCETSVGSFSIPVTPGVTISNIGFHDVRYHSGDGPGNVAFDGTDWVGAESGGAVTWSTAQTYAQNPSANAIRWGTTYNFRFDANALPIAGNATVGHFKTAGADSAAGPGSGRAQRSGQRRVLLRRRQRHGLPVRQQQPGRLERGLPELARHGRQPRGRRFGQRRRGHVRAERRRHAGQLGPLLPGHHPDLCRASGAVFGDGLRCAGRLGRAPRHDS